MTYDDWKSTPPDNDEPNPCAVCGGPCSGEDDLCSDACAAQVPELGEKEHESNVGDR